MDATALQEYSRQAHHSLKPINALIFISKQHSDSTPHSFLNMSEEWYRWVGTVCGIRKNRFRICILLCKANRHRRDLVFRGKDKRDFVGLRPA